VEKSNVPKESDVEGGRQLCISGLRSLSPVLGGSSLPLLSDEKARLRAPL